MVKDLIMMFYKSTGGYKPHRVIMYRYVFTTLGGLWDDFGLWNDFLKTGLWEDSGMILDFGMTFR